MHTIPIFLTMKKFSLDVIKNSNQIQYYNILHPFNYILPELLSTSTVKRQRSGHCYCITSISCVIETLPPNVWQPNCSVFWHCYHYHHSVISKKHSQIPSFCSEGYCHYSLFSVFIIFSISINVITFIIIFIIIIIIIIVNELVLLYYCHYF